MNANGKTTGDAKAKLSIMWVVVMLNMAFADILSFMYPGFLEDVMTGSAGGVHITQEFLLIAAICLEIPIVMVFLSRILNYRANRWANVAAAVITSVFVIRGGSTYLHYVFFTAAEIIFMALIVWNAWKLPKAESPVLVSSRTARAGGHSTLDAGAA